MCALLLHERTHSRLAHALLRTTGMQPKWGGALSYLHKKGEEMVRNGFR